jgi:hypothetical protein
VAATQPNNVTAAMTLAFEFFQSCGEDPDEMSNRHDKQAARQNERSEHSERIKDADDETHALSILRRLEEPARSLNVHLSASDGQPDWDGLWGKSVYTGGDQPWPINMIDTELAHISDYHAADSSTARLNADKMVQALAAVCVIPNILDLPLTVMP